MCSPDCRPLMKSFITAKGCSRVICGTALTKQTQPLKSTTSHNYTCTAFFSLAWEKRDILILNLVSSTGSTATSAHQTTSCSPHRAIDAISNTT